MAILVPQTDGSSAFRVGSTDVLYVGKAGYQRSVNVLRLASNASDTETITIGADVYEIDTNATYTAGRIPVTTADGTPTNVSAALVTAINASSTERVTASAISVNEVLVIATDLGAVVTPCTETLAGTNNVFSANAMYGGSAIANARYEAASRVPVTQEVNIGNIHFYFDFTVKYARALVYTTSTGAAIAHDGVLTISGNRVTLDNSGSTDWSTSTTVAVFAAE